MWPLTGLLGRMSVGMMIEPTIAWGTQHAPYSPGCTVSRAGRPTLAQATHRSSTACSRSASGSSAACPLPAPSLRSLAVPPRSRAFSAAALLTGSAAQNGEEAAAGQELVQDGTDSVGGLAGASAVPGGPAGQAARDDVLLLARVPVRQPQPQDATDELRPRKYRKHSAERA